MQFTPIVMLTITFKLRYTEMLNMYTFIGIIYWQVVKVGDKVIVVAAPQHAN